MKPTATSPRPKPGKLKARAHIMHARDIRERADARDPNSPCGGDIALEDLVQQHMKAIAATGRARLRCRVRSVHMAFHAK